MSTTTDEAVALTFAKEGDARTASTLVVASMGMIDRGATLDWLSQYPHEREILLPPLTAMEVVDIEDFVDSGAFQIRKLHVRLNTNMVRRGEMLTPDSVIDLLAIELVGIVPEDENVVVSSNRGSAVALDEKSLAGEAFRNIARRLQGETVPFIDLDRKDGLFGRLSKMIGRGGN